MRPSICHIWYYTTLRLVNLEGNGNISGTRRLSSTGLDGPKKDQVGWRGYLSPKSGGPASILGSPAIYFQKGKKVLFPPFHVSNGSYAFFFYFVGCMLKGCYIFLFFATILYHFSGELPQDSGSPAGLPESN